MKIKFIFSLIFLLTMYGCTTVGDAYNWVFNDKEKKEIIITNESKNEISYEDVTVNIKDKIAVKVANPLGPRATGSSCAIWKSNTGENGRCAWNTKGQCFCPSPE